MLARLIPGTRAIGLRTHLLQAPSAHRLLCTAAADAARARRAAAAAARPTSAPKEDEALRTALRKARADLGADASPGTIAARVRADPNAHAHWDYRRVRQALDAMEPNSGLVDCAPWENFQHPPSAAEREREQREREKSYGTPVPKAIVAERPTWLPVNKYLHEGKEVVKISGSAVYGCRSTIHYADGSIQTESGAGDSKSSIYSRLDGLIKQFGFITYKSMEHERYYAGPMFEAVPLEDPSEWEEIVIPRGTPVRLSGSTVSGWRRKVERKADHDDLDRR
jgi:hypothetical protein